MLVEPLLSQARATPGNVAIHDDHGVYTIGQLAAAAVGISRLVAAQSARPSVAVMLPASFGFAASFYGILLAGKSVVPVNFLLGEKEVRHVLSDSGVDTVITIPIFAAKLQDCGLKIIDITQLLKADTAAGSGAAQELPDPPKKSPDDLAVLIYTSGTSGLPKGVILSYENLQSDVDGAIEHAQLKHQHVFLGVIPLFHSFGVTAMMLAPIQLGATIIYMARFNPTAVVNAIRQHGVSLMFAVPSMYNAIMHLKNAGPEDFKSTYALISGGEPLPESLRERFFERFKVRLHEGYGLTETSPVVSLNMPTSFRPGSVGKAIPGAEIRITDESGNPVPKGGSGEVWLRGPMVMRGYHNLPTETKAALTPDRYFKTGDLGRFDADGFLYITGRKKDLIIVAGEKAAPREIEDVLLKHPAVSESAVVGKKDPSRGEVVVAFVVLVDHQEINTDSLKDFCRDQGLPQWKIPREIFIEKELPHSPTGKVLKRELAQRVNG